jgi:hypothetical protein
MSSNPGAGHEYKPIAVSWLKRDLLLFANTIGTKADDLHFLFVSFALEKLPIGKGKKRINR